MPMPCCREHLDLCGSIFLQEARFKGASFQSGARFESAALRDMPPSEMQILPRPGSIPGGLFFRHRQLRQCRLRLPGQLWLGRFCELCTNFGEASFLDDADFTQAKFSGTANFRLASFGGSASFWKAIFLADANFQGAKFMGYASFQSAILSGNADFRGANFSEELNMEFASFQGNAIFLGSNIAEDANFFRAELLDVNFKMPSCAAMCNSRRQSWAEVSSRELISRERHPSRDPAFKRMCFSIVRSSRNLPVFIQSKFQAEAVFEQAVFAGEAQFSDVSFSMKLTSKRQVLQEASFSASEFQANARFDSAEFLEDAFFQGTQFTRLGKFLRLKFSKEPDLWQMQKFMSCASLMLCLPGRFDLHNADFVRLEVRWPTLCHHLAYDGAAYLSLAKNFRNLEWFEDADDCYYHYRRMSQSGKILVRSGRKM